MRFILLAMLLAVACARKGDGLQALVDQKFAAMNAHDLESLGSLYADSARISSPNFTNDEIGPAGARDAYRRYFTTSPDLKYVVTHVTYGTNDVVIEYTSEGTMVALEQNVPAYMKDKKYKLNNVTRITVQNGKIVEETTYFDQVAFLRQMGFFEQPGK